MESITDRAARILARNPAPALPLSRLRRLVRNGGMPVSDASLLRALTVGGDRFRVVDPWRGPRRELRGHRRAGPRARWRDDAPPTPSAPATPTLLERRWVLADPRLPEDVADRGALLRLRRTVAHLGWRLDDGSPRQAARWCRLVSEATRFRERSRAA